MSEVLEITDDLCLVCHKPRSNHNFLHRFAELGGPNSLIIRTDENDESMNDRSQGDPVAQGRVRMPTTGDPVLRMALIRKGVITPKDLDDVEEELKATGVAGYDPATLG